MIIIKVIEGGSPLVFGHSRLTEGMSGQVVDLDLGEYVVAYDVDVEADYTFSMREINSVIVIDNTSIESVIAYVNNNRELENKYYERKAKLMEVSGITERQYRILENNNMLGLLDHIERLDDAFQSVLDKLVILRGSITDIEDQINA
jgi:hypothetical protein